MRQLLKGVIALGIICLGIWYFAIKDDHYQISFTTKQPAGVVYQHILNWESYVDTKTLKISNSLEKPYSKIEQNIKVSDSSFLYKWDIVKNSDGKTKVTASIKDLQNGFIQKLQTPFIKNDFVQRNIRQVKTVGDGLATKGKTFKVHGIKDSVFDGGFCIYLPIESPIKRKAATMLYNITDLMGYINDNELDLKGDPYLEVTQWNEEAGTFNYNFCFPIEKSDSLPKTTKVLFKETPPVKGLKAEFNGNYKDSYNAWYYLLEYANTNNIKVKKLPTEIFLNDPHSGGDALNWKALIFLPLND